MKMVKNLLFLICLLSFQNILYAMGQNPITDIHSQMHVQNPQLYLQWAERYFGNVIKYGELTDYQQRLMTERVSAIQLFAIIEKNYKPNKYINSSSFYKLPESNILKKSNNILVPHFSDNHPESNLTNNISAPNFGDYDNENIIDKDKNLLDDCLHDNLQTSLKPVLNENNYNEIVEYCHSQNKKNKFPGAFLIAKNKSASPAQSYPITIEKLLFGYTLKEWKTKWRTPTTKENIPTEIDLDNWSEFLPNKIKNKFLSDQHQKFNNYRLQAQAEIGSDRFNTLFQWKCLYSVIGGAIGLAFGSAIACLSHAHNQAIIGSTTSIGALIGAIQANNRIDLLEKKEINAINRTASALYKQDPDCDVDNSDKIIRETLKTEPYAEFFKIAKTKNGENIVILTIKPKMEPSNLHKFNHFFQRKFSAKQQITALKK